MNEDDSSDKECLCPDCGCKCYYTEQNGSLITCPHCYAQFALKYAQSREPSTAITKASMDSDQYLCEECGLDCNAVKTNYGSLVCPRCGTTVLSPTKNSNVMRGSYTKKLNIEPTFGKPTKKEENKIIQPILVPDFKKPVKVVAKCLCGKFTSVTVEQIRDDDTPCPECGDELSIFIVCQSCEAEILTNCMGVGAYCKCPVCGSPNYWNRMIGVEGIPVISSITGRVEMQDLETSVAYVSEQVKVIERQREIEEKLTQRKPVQTKASRSEGRHVKEAAEMAAFGVGCLGLSIIQALPLAFGIVIAVMMLKSCS